MPEQFKIKIIRHRVPKTCVCPDCGVKQPFKSAGPYGSVGTSIGKRLKILILIDRFYSKFKLLEQNA